jgi:hypothetical protein
MSEVLENFVRPVVIQIRDSRNTVAFKRPRVAKKPPLLIVEQALLYELSHQLNHLAQTLSSPPETDSERLIDCSHGTQVGLGGTHGLCGKATQSSYSNY